MQLSVFSTDSQKSGFRLQYLQVLNWGTFDKDIYTIRPDGETSLLTGANASGKTTLVDALLTLIVPEKRYRFYNQSSGTKKKDDRTEESYVLGGFGHTNSVETGSTKTEYLRPEKDKAYSILLVHFSNEDEQVVTLFQVRHFQGGELKKYFGVARKALTIEADFTPFDLSGNWKRALDIKYNKGVRHIEWFDGATNYARRMVEVLGFRSTQALQLFNHTVGIKVLDNLDQFIRSNMLEPRNIEDEYQSLKEQLKTLIEARTKMEKAEAQIELLTPLIERYERTTTLKEEIEHLDTSLETVKAWRLFTRYSLLKEAVHQAEQELKDVEIQIGELQATIEELIEDERAIQSQIDGNKAGQRLKELEGRLRELQSSLAKATHSKDRFISWIQTAALSLPDQLSSASYVQVKKDAAQKQKDVESEKQANGRELLEATNAHSEAGKQIQMLEQQISSMQQNRNNLDYWLTDLRMQICTELKIAPAELPFAAELMQVRQDESDWEPALEKLLKGFARRLLVPDKHYKRVTRYINGNNLRARIVYEQVQPSALNQYATPGTVPEKLEFHPEHELSDWLEQAIIQRFSHFCIPDDKHIERHEKAVTLSGLIKEGRRHEKDDRPSRGGAASYVMGWDNERKKATLQAELGLQKDITRKKEEVIRRCKNREERLVNQRFAIKEISEHQGFAELDEATIEKNITKVSEQIAQLQKSDQKLSQLKKQLEGVLEKRRATTTEKDNAVGQKGAIGERAARFSKGMSELESIVSNFDEEEKDRLLAFQQSNSNVLNEINLENIDKKFDTLSSGLSADLDRKQNLLFTEERLMLNQINTIKNPAAKYIQKFTDWPADVQHLPIDPKYVSEYKDWLEALTTENLPKYRKEFENFINTTITHKVAGLKETLDAWEREIEHHVNKLNESLRGINFNRLPDTYIQLGKRKMPAGTEVRSFRQRLLEALPQLANWQQDSFEAKAAHFSQKVQPLIDELDEQEYRRKVLDVRNWFEFWADEFYKGDDTQKKTFRQMGQLSGGEKAQLTYTILCSAIAYQFGITREGKSSRSLRFIAVDESFSNQDEEKSTYLMELCKELHLQLLVVTPSDKIHIVQDFIAHVHLVQRVANRNSTLYNMTIKELKQHVTEQSQTNRSEILV